MITIRHTASGGIEYVTKSLEEAQMFAVSAHDGKAIIPGSGIVLNPGSGGYWIVRAGNASWDTMLAQAYEAYRHQAQPMKTA